MMTFVTRRGAEGREDKNKDRKLREAKAEARKRVLVACSCARVGRKDVVGEVKGVEVMGLLVAGRGARERGGRRLEVEITSLSAEALAMMCSTLFLRPLKKAAS